MIIANDLFGGLGGGLGGLMKGLSSFMPQDDPAVKMLNTQTEVSSLQKQELELYAEIGKQAASQYRLDSSGEIGNFHLYKPYFQKANKDTISISLHFKIHTKS